MTRLVVDFLDNGESFRAQVLTDGNPVHCDPKRVAALYLQGVFN